jgi:hypothetical protein
VFYIPEDGILHNHRREKLKNSNFTTDTPNLNMTVGNAKLNKNKLRGLQSASELYRLSDRHLSAKFSANFCG